MRICGMCGTQNDDSSLNCVNCGANLYSDVDITFAEPYGNPGQMGYNGGQPYGDPNQMGYNGGQPYGDPNQMGYNGGQPYGNPNPMGYPGEPPKKSSGKKGWLIGILIAVALIIIAVVVVIVVQKNKESSVPSPEISPNGITSPEQVAEEFIEAMDEQNVDKLANLCPPFLDPAEDELQSMIGAYSGYDVTFTYEGVVSKEEYTDTDLEELQEDVSDYAEKSVKLQDACDLEFSFNVTVTMYGETMSESSTYTITCIKYRGGWYLYE